MNRRFFLTKSPTYLVAAFALSSMSGSVAAQTVRNAARPAAPLTIGVAIDRSGRQRMLSQRMAKAYAQLLNGTIPERSQKVLRDSDTDFDAALTALEAFAADADSRRALEAQRNLWIRYRSELQASRTPAGLANVMALSEEVLKTAEAATVALSKVAGTSSGRMVNLSGRQRMLSQRIAKFYAFGVATKDGQARSKEIDESSKQFTAAAKELGAFPQNNAYIGQMLVVAESQWAFYERAFRDSAGRDLRVAAEDVAKASENLLQTMDLVTAQYATIAG